MMKYGATLIECPNCHLQVPHYRDGVTTCLACGATIEGDLNASAEYTANNITSTPEGATAKINLPSIRPNETLKVNVTFRLKEKPDGK